MKIAHDVINLDCLYLLEAQSRREVLRKWSFLHNEKRGLAVYLA